MMDLKGRHAVVTGGGRGIGAAISSALAREGANVTLLGRDLRTLEAHAASLESAQSVQCDISHESTIKAAFTAARAKFGPIEVLVNNAGQSHVAVVQKTELKDFESILRVNLTGAFLCTKEVLPAMLDGRYGRIVNIASTAGLKGYTRMSAYCASKHALVGFTRAVALEVATKGVTVNAVCPTYTESDMTTEGIKSISTRLNISAEEALSQLTKQIPQGTMVTADQIAAAVLWLCSEQASSITGVALPIAGGEVM